MPTRDGQWTDEELHSCLEPGWDQSKMHHQERVYKFPEIFGFFDPDELMHGPAAPPEVQVAFEETFGDAAKIKREHGRPDLILRLHPWFRRWTIFEFCSTGTKDTGNGRPARAWQPKMVLCADADPAGKDFEDARPHDLRDRRYSEIWGRVGEYKLPDRRDFEDYKEKCDRHGLSTAERHAKFQADANRESQEWNRIVNDYERDFCDYGYAAYYRDLVRCIGGGQGLPFLPQTSLEEFARGRELLVPVEDSEGRVLYHRRYSKEKLKRIAEDIAAAEERWREAVDEAGLSKVKLAATYIAFGKELPPGLAIYADDAERERRLTEMRARELPQEGEAARAARARAAAARQTEAA